MKQKKVRLLGLLLAAVMLLGCLPVQALAAEGVAARARWQTARVPCQI